MHTTTRVLNDDPWFLNYAPCLARLFGMTPRYIRSDSFFSESKSHSTRVQRHGKTNCRKLKSRRNNSRTGQSRNSFVAFFVKEHNYVCLLGERTRSSYSLPHNRNKKHNNIQGMKLFRKQVFRLRRAVNLPITKRNFFATG